MTRDVGRLMHQAALAHWRAVQEADDHYAECEEAECSHVVDDPSLAPYCGCEDCVVREVLAGAWPVIAPLLSSRLRHDDANTESTKGPS